MTPDDTRQRDVELDNKDYLSIQQEQEDEENIQLEPTNLRSINRRLDLSDAQNDNYWSTSLYSEDPVLTSSRCVSALRDFFNHPSLLAVATESSSHPTGLQSVLAQPWLYAGGGLGNIPECPLQSCLAGAGTRRDSITFASVCVPYECHAQDLAAHDFPASLNLVAQDVLALADDPDDDDDPLEFIDHPKRYKRHEKRMNKTAEQGGADAFNPNNVKDSENDKIWWHSSPGQQRAFAEEYITLHTKIFYLNDFLQTGWTCGNYQVPFEAFPFGVPYLMICAGLILLTLQGTYYGRDYSKVDRPPKKQAPRKVLIETDQALNVPENHSNNLNNGAHEMRQENSQKANTDKRSYSGLSSVVASTNPTQTSSVSLSSDPSEPGDELRNSEKEKDHGAEADNNSFIASHWNASKHWHTLCTSRHEATACLDGLRVWSIIWVMLGHVMAIQSSSGGGYSNPVDFLPPSGLTTTFFGQLIFASRFAVDTFLVISGYLLVIVIVRKAPTLINNQRRKTTTFFQLIGLRLLRIMPLYLLCMGFYTQVAPHLYLSGQDSNDGGGPFWYQWDSLLQPCRDYGWTNLLFINNFIPFEKSNTETCFYHSWYLAVDMQLFVLFGLPVTFFIFLKNPTRGKRVTLAMWAISVLLTAYLAYVRHWSINTFDGLPVALFDVEAYAKPHVRGQSYFAGMYVAMMQLTRTSPQTVTPTTWKDRALLLSSLAALGCVTFCTVTGAYARRPCQYTEFPAKNDCGSLWSATATFIYAASSRAIWSGSIGVLMMLCLDGKGGWLNRFMSWHIWAPLSQLSFGAYLIHPIVIFVWLLGMQQKSVYSLATFGMSLTSVCCVSFALAVVAAVLVEFPVATLIASIIKKKARQGQSVGQEVQTRPETKELIGSRRQQENYGAT